MLSTVSVSVASDSYYAELEAMVANAIAKNTDPLFTTTASGLFTAYLNGLPKDSWQHYNCNCCRRFIEKFGGLVKILDGIAVPFLWNENKTPVFFLNSIKEMNRIICKAQVNGVFVNGYKEWGTKQTGVWTHLHGAPSSFFLDVKNTAYQKMAEKKQDFIILQQSLHDYPIEAVKEAVRVLKANVIDRSEKTYGVAEWFLGLHSKINGVKGARRNNLIWEAVATAPIGWCHVRTTMIHTLLDDIIEGLPFDSVKERWNKKMHPLQYQRPTASPKEGNIIQANKIIEKLGSEGSLQRRYARLEEVVAFWKPTTIPFEPKEVGKPFDYLLGKNKIKQLELPTIRMPWDKFEKEILPDALEIELSVPQQGPFFGLVTAVNPETPPILQWDGEPRNPVSWFFYHGGSPASKWNLIPKLWTKVNAICLKPCHWYSDKFAHQGGGIFFILQGAHETVGSGLCLFPEILRSEYREIRSVLEAHSKNMKLENPLEGTANGICLNPSCAIDLKVYTKTHSQEYSVLG